MASLTVLGTASGAPVPESGCSAYLVQHDGVSLLLDCGAGTLGALRSAIEVHSLAAVVITHMHSDHFLDLVVLNIALLGERASASGAQVPLASIRSKGAVTTKPHSALSVAADLTEPAPKRRRVPVFLPPGGLETLTQTFHALTVNVSGTNAARWTEALDCREYAAGDVLDVGSCSVEIVGPMRHATLAFGMRVTAGSSVLGYTGDTAPCDAELQVARDTQLFLAECTFPEAGVSPAAGHSSALELGEIAARSGCQRLVATHFGYALWPAEPAAREAAINERVRAGGYGGPLEMAAKGKRFDF